MAALPEPVLAYYGDDFTGSTDVMEVLALNGLQTTLFLDPPTDRQLARYPGTRALGIAGRSRARPPAWMELELPRIFETLAAFRPLLVHYKVCSTFDSSPTVGSVGRALDIGRHVLAEHVPSPIVVGAPALRRYCVFGNLFATVDGVAYRLDRHPTMSRHPVTPMNESDLRLHLARQTSARIELFDLLALAAPDCRRRYEDLCRRGGDAVLFDVFDSTSLETIGELVWEAVPRSRFSVSSSGLEYALTAYWRKAGLLPDARPALSAHPHRQAIGVSGSCSPATAAQIALVERLGWCVLSANARRLASADAAERARLLTAASRALDAGCSVLIESARGPEDPRIGELAAHAGSDAGARERANDAIGSALGDLLRELLMGSGVRRAFVAGGDTSSAAARALGIEAVTMEAPLTPGSPLCRAHAPGDALDGLEISFKGGQTGGPAFFEQVRLGRADIQPQSERRTTCLQ